MNMSIRERMMIFVLAALVILLGGFKFLIEPEIKRLGSAVEEKDRVYAERQKIRNEMIMGNSYAAENESLREKIITAQAAFMPELQSDRVHIFIQDKLDIAGITCDSLTIADKTAKQVINVQPPVNELVYPAKTAAESLEETDPAVAANNSDASKKTTGQTGSGAATAGKLPGDLLEMMTVTVRFNGTYESMLRLIDAIRDSGRTARVTSVRINAITGSPGRLDVTVSAECYGIRKFIGEDAMQEALMPSPAGRYDPFLP